MTEKMIVALVALALTATGCGSKQSSDGSGGANGGTSSGGGGSGGSSANGGGGGGSSGGGGVVQGGLRAFAGAEGFGTETPGGRGGTVYEVTTLDWDGPGSFAEALFATGPRIIVFRVSGVIDVPEDAAPLDESHSFVTVAGQTSPGGITFRGGGAALNNYHSNFHDAVFRFLRFRGNGAYDNISLNEAHHFVIDHCDFSGAEDEAFDITFSHDFTVQWSTVTNSGPNGQVYGQLIAYAPTTRITLHHNFSAHHVNRCGPHMHWGSDGAPAEGADIDYRNNVIYDCAFEKAMDISGPDTGSAHFNLVGNFGKAGPNTPATDAVAFIGLGASVSVFESDNVYDPGHPILTVWSDPQQVTTAFDFPAVTTEPAAVAYQSVIQKVGAWPRDPMNTRTLAEAESGTGQIGNIGDPLIESGPEPPTDADHDGMPDDWESAHQLDPSDPSDGSADRDGDGYTNVEEYLDQRAAGLTGNG